LPTQPLAVIDIGSNSGRIIVVRVTANGHLEILSEARTSLRLMSDIDKSGSLSAAAEERTLAALFDFMAVAAGSGARRTIALATAAVREAANSDQFVARLRRETGLNIRVIDGDEEARLAFSGAVNGLPIDHGMLVDVGGGSLEIAHFRNRRAQESWTLPLGALRLTDVFLGSDPPKQNEIAALQDHVLKTLRSADVIPMRDDERMVGTGGTIRNLAKMHRATITYPIPRLHGYTLGRKALRDIGSRLVARRLVRRAALPGLSADRADSIAGGVLVVQTVVESLGAGDVTVSGQGLREGVVYEEFARYMPSPAAVRRASIAAIASRFTTWDGDRARRRARVAGALWDVMLPGASEELRDALEQAATILDVGRSVDYYRRWDHAAEIVVSADLHGFSHRSIGMMASLIVRAGKGRASFDPYSMLWDAADSRGLNRAAVLLALADEVERRMPRGAAVSVARQDDRKDVVLTVPMPHDWMPGELAARFRGVFGRELVLEGGSGDRLGAAGIAVGL